MYKIEYVCIYIYIYIYIHTHAATSLVIITALHHPRRAILAIHVTHMNESHHTYQRVMSHTSTSHITHINISHEFIRNTKLPVR